MHLRQPAGQQIEKLITLITDKYELSKHEITGKKSTKYNDAFEIIITGECVNRPLVKECRLSEKYFLGFDNFMMEKQGGQMLIFRFPLAELPKMIAKLDGSEKHNELKRATVRANHN